MIQPLPRMPGELVPRDGYNEAMAAIEWLARLRAIPPLYTDLDASGPEIRIDGLALLDSLSGAFVDSSTIDTTYSGGTFSFAVITQMSITVDASGIKLVNDATTPGNNKVYGTNSSGTRGWQADGKLSIQSTDTTIDHFTSKVFPGDHLDYTIVTTTGDALTIDVKESTLRRMRQAAVLGNP